MELDLEQARRRAKERLRAARRGEITLREDREPRLADAQRSVANELGFPSWPALVAHVGGDRRGPRAAADAARRGGARRARRPRRGAARRGPGARARRPRGGARARRRGGGRGGAGARPGARSRACCPARAGGRCRARATPRSSRPTSRARPACGAWSSCCSTRGADPNETFDNEYGAMPVLYGAAGVAHDPATTRLLLDRGANPDDGESVYHAVEAQDTACLEILLERGATVREHERARQRAAAARHAAAAARARRPAPVRPRAARRAAVGARGGVGAAADRPRRRPRGARPRRADAVLGRGAPRRRGADGRARRGRRGHRAPTRWRSGSARWCAATPAGRSGRARPRDRAARHADAELLPMFASAGHDEVVERLLDAGVPLHARGVDDGTALHYAGMWGRPEHGRAAARPRRRAEPDGRPAPSTRAPRSAGPPGARATLDPEGERVEDYVAAARALIAAGASV